MYLATKAAYYLDGQEDKVFKSPKYLNHYFIPLLFRNRYIYNYIYIYNLWKSCNRNRKVISTLSDLHACKSRNENL